MLASLRKALSPPETARQLGRLLVLHGGLGIFVGLVAAGFVPLVHAAQDLLITPLLSTNAEEIGFPTGLRWLVLLVPAAGGLASGWLCTRLAPEAMGTGTGSVIDAYHRHDGAVRRRAPGVKILASILTIGTGGSAGVEGPIGFIGAGLGSVLTRAFGVSAQERRVLLMAGFAAGIGAVFHAPLAASLFAAEVLYRDLDFEHEVLVPAIISSTIAYSVYGAIHGWNPIWTVPDMTFGSVFELIPYLVLAVVCAGGGALFIKIHSLVHRHLGQAQPIPLWARPAIGGLGVGIVALFVPGATGAGYGLAQAAIDGNTPILVLMVFAVAKMLTSSLTAGSGGSGGLFAPSLVIGALLGGVVAAATQWVAPGLGVSSAAFGIVGMAGFFAAVINAPISTVVMVSELAGSYHLLVPTLWVCALAWFLLRRTALYSEQASSRLDAPGHVSNMMEAILRRMNVREAMVSDSAAVETVRPGLPLRDLIAVFSRTVQGVFPILSESGKLIGVVDGLKLRRTVGEMSVRGLLVAHDFCADAVTASADESLHVVVRRMTATGYDELLVMEGEKLLGLISRREVVSAYHRRMLERTDQMATRATLPRTTQGEKSTPAQQLADAMERGEVLVGVEGEGADDLLAAIVAKADFPPECDRTQLLEMLLAREALGSTNLGDGIALPHPQTESIAGLSGPRLLVAQLGQATLWHASDREQSVPDVETVLVLLAPRGAVHLALLGALARSLNNPGMRRLLRQRVSKDKLLRKLQMLADESAAPVAAQSTGS
ncbi:MAG: chloride channel protein [Nannocystaceae bacterium]|nr:chloride channel protein [Nannocystaceae bacterium]